MIELAELLSVVIGFGRIGMPIRADTGTVLTDANDMAGIIFPELIDELAKILGCTNIPAVIAVIGVDLYRLVQR